MRGSDRDRLAEEVVVRRGELEGEISVMGIADWSVDCGSLRGVACGARV